MKLCFCLDSLGSGGAERVVSVLTNEFVKRNIEVFIILVSSLNKKSFYFIDSKAHLISICENYKKKPKFIKRAFLLRKAFKTIKPDIIISFMPHIIIYSYFASRGLNIPFVVSERSSPIQRKKRNDNKLNDYVYKHADGCVFQTKDAFAYYENILKKSCVSKIIYNPCNIEYGYNFDKSLSSNTIVSSGRLSESKNYPLLLDTFKKFNLNHNNEFILKIYGVGELEDYLKSYAKKLNIENNVLFMGTDNDWIKHNLDCKFYILSSDYEGMPNSLLEAMCAGIPCISSDCPIGGPKALIQDSDNGLLFETGNSKKLLDCMEKYANSNEFRENISENNKLFYVKFKAETICDKWLELISLVKEKYYGKKK